MYTERGCTRIASDPPFPSNPPVGLDTGDDGLSHPSRILEPSFPCRISPPRDWRRRGGGGCHTDSNTEGGWIGTEQPLLSRPQTGDWLAERCVILM